MNIYSRKLEHVTAYPKIIHMFKPHDTSSTTNIQNSAGLSILIYTTQSQRKFTYGFSKVGSVQKVLHPQWTKIRGEDLMDNLDDFLYKYSFWM